MILPQSCCTYFINNRQEKGIQFRESVNLQALYDHTCCLNGNGLVQQVLFLTLPE